MQKASTFIHIVESPSSVDLLDGRTEGRSLSAFLDLANIPNCYSLVTDSNTFGLAMQERLYNAIGKFNAFPILHLSSHGNKKEIRLTNDESVSWDLLANKLTPINESMGGSLVVCISACSGLAANNMIWKSESGLPMKTLVSSRGEIDWHQAAVAYATFYNHFLVLGKSIDKSVAAMKAASGCNDFIGSDSADLKNKLDALKKTPIEEIKKAFRLLNKPTATSAPVDG